MNHAGAIVFDVNETLLDLAGLDPYFEEVLGAAAGRREWFAAVLQATMVTTIIGRYASLTDLGGACLESLARRVGRRIGPAERDRLIQELIRLPAQPDVVEALAALRERGFRLAALTNNPLLLVRSQLRHAGLAGFFSAVMSADEVGRLKPAAEPYHFAAGRLGIAIGDLTMVAAHGWDCAGAQAAGARAVFVARPGQAPSPGGPEPDLSVTGLRELPAALAP